MSIRRSSARPAAASHFTSPTAAVERARAMLNIERDLGKVSDSLFDTIVVNEFRSATSLAASMLGDYRTASEAVLVAFETARFEFSAYDGTENPRSWILGFVAEEAVRRSGRVPDERCHDRRQADASSALGCLKPEGRLAVILTDVLGLGDEAAARISRVDLATIRQRAESARAWLARHLTIPATTRTGMDGAMG